MQSLLLFFIDGASRIDATDERWAVAIMCSNDAARSVIAYASMYSFLFFPDKERIRISQFFVMPPHQRRGLGSILYRAILQRAILAREDVLQVTVEDPSQAFADFRLSNDYRLLIEAAREPGGRERLLAKLAPLQRLQLGLLEAYHALLPSHAAAPSATCTPLSISGRALERRFKRAAQKLFPDCIPTEAGPAQERAVQELFEGECERFKRIISDRILSSASSLTASCQAHHL